MDDLYATHAARLRGLAAAIVFDSSCAEEIVHDAFAGLMTAETQAGNVIENPAGYLQRSVINLAITHRRRSGRFQQTPTPPARHSSIPEIDETWVALGALPRRQRAIVILRFYDDQSYEQIADTLDIPLGTVKSTLHRALRTLKEQL